MSLFLVRHGQASFGSENYDQLSSVGEQQSLALGRWLANCGENFAAVRLGRLQRHRQTLDALQIGIREHGGALPEAEVDADLDEFEHRGVVAAFLAESPEHAAAMQDVARARMEPRRVFTVLRSALGAWAAGGLDHHPVERWSDFQQRTRVAGERLLAASRAGPVLAISSGGVISQLAQHALELSDQRAVEFNLALRNSAICEFYRDESNLRLGSWNTLPHLATQRELWTHF